MDKLRLDQLNLSAAADRVVAWHNRHPLARRISAAQVHAIGYVALPFTAEAPPAAAPSAAQAAAQAIAAAAATPLPVLTEVAQAAAADPQTPPEGSRLRERALARAREPAADLHGAHAADTAAAVLATLAPATLKRDFDEHFIDTLTPRQVARFALKHGRVLARAPLDGPVREVLAGAGQPDRRKRIPAQVYLLSAVIETDTRKSRVLLGNGPLVLGRRIHSSARVTACALLGAGLVGAPIWWMQPRPALSEAAGGTAATAATAAVAPASAPASAPVPVPPVRAAEAAPVIPMIEPPAAPPPEPETRRRGVSIVPLLSEEEKTRAREQRQALLDAAAPSASSAAPAPAPAPMPAPVPVPAPAPVAAAVKAAPPAAPVFAISTRALRTRAEADQVRVAMQSLLQTLGHAQMRVDVLPQGEDWRVVALPFAQRADAEKGRALLAARGMRVAVVDF